MRIHALQTGTVDVTRAFLHARPGVAGRLALLHDRDWVTGLPIHAWLIEHDGRRILVDTGETAGIKNLPFVRYRVTAADELPHALAAVGPTVDDLDTVVLTHLHNDHVDGAVHVKQPVLVAEGEWRAAHGVAGRFTQLVTRAPLPKHVDYRPFGIADGPFGAFAASHRLTDDGRVLAVATPGHTPGHVSIVAIDDEGRHVLLAGDATDTLEQLHARRADAIAPKPSVQIATIDRILAHAREHPTVYLPAHDPESSARLDARTLLVA